MGEERDNEGEVASQRSAVIALLGSGGTGNIVEPQRPTRTLQIAPKLFA